MTTFPYSDLLAQVEALAGATLATPERNRVKIFANRRARKAHRECDYWPHLLHVGEERIVSEEGLMPLAQTGLQTIDKIIRIHAQDPFKSQAVYEYTEYYHDASGIQIAGYEAAEATTGADMIVSGTLNPDITGRYRFTATVTGQNGGTASSYTLESNPNYTINPFLSASGGQDFASWLIGSLLDPVGYWQLEFPTLLSEVPTPAGLTYFESGSATGTLVVTSNTIYSAFITYLAGIPATYGDGEGEESDVPEPWFEYMAQGAYTDWLRSDGQTEKAMAEEVIAESLLNQQLEKVSRSNGNQVVTRMMSHATKQAR
jgi:hypothetical protein